MRATPDFGTKERRSLSFARRRNLYFVASQAQLAPHRQVGLQAHWAPQMQGPLVSFAHPHDALSHRHWFWISFVIGFSCLQRAVLRTVTGANASRPVALHLVPKTCRPCSAHHSLSGSSCPVQTEWCKRRSSESVRWERGPRGGRQPGAGNRPSGVVERWRRGREQRGQWMERCGGSCSARLGWRLEIGSGTQTQLSAADYTCRIHLKYGRRPTRGSAVAAGRLLPLGARKLRAVSYSANSRSLGRRMRCCWYPTARRA